MSVDREPKSKCHDDQKLINALCRTILSSHTDLTSSNLLSPANKIITMKVAPAGQNKKKSPAKAGKSSPKKTTTKSGDGKRTAVETILGNLAYSLSLGNQSMPRDELLKLSNMAPKTLANNLTKLKQKKLVEFDGTSIRLTEKGIEEAGASAQPPTTNQEIQERIKESLKGKQILLLEALDDGETHPPPRRHCGGVEL